jgi:sec-independent protein translocase protein TatB
LFDIGWTEMLVLGVVILLVVGPRELPSLLRTMGQYVGKFRQIASEFRGQMDDMGRDILTGVSSELGDEVDIKKLKKSLQEVDIGVPDLFDTTDEKDNNG